MKISNPKGFTLVEIVVAIALIGILASLSITQYQKNQRKALQAEGKLGVSAMFALEKSFHAEYSAYIPAFDSIGYQPEGSKRYFQSAACGNAGSPWTGTVTGYKGSSTVNSYSANNIPWPWTWNPRPGFACLTACTSYGNDPQYFQTYEIGTLCPTCYNDIWSIDQTKTLVNCQLGL